MDELEELGVFTLALHQGEEVAGLREGIPSRTTDEPPLADAPVPRVVTAGVSRGYAANIRPKKGPRCRIFSRWCRLRPTSRSTVALSWT